MELPYEIWDVFTDTPLSGNPLALVPDASGLGSGQMQAVAREFNLSETSFVLPSEVADVRARYFTPARELPVAGHPSVGTVYALHAAGRLAKESATLELGVGVREMGLELANGRLERVWMNQGKPELVSDLSGRAEVAAALGLTEADLANFPLQIVSAGVPFLLVPLNTLGALGKVALELDALPPDLPSDHHAVFAFTTDAPESDIRSRMFGAAMGITEDPATGAAHGPLGWYVKTHGLLRPQDGIVSFVSHQGVEMGRKSVIHVRVDSADEVQVGGQAVKVASGTLHL